MPLTKKEEKWKPDPGMVEMMQESIESAQTHLDHTKTWVDRAEQRLKWARYRLERYRKDGTYLPLFPKEEGEKETKTK